MGGNQNDGDSKMLCLFVRTMVLVILLIMAGREHMPPTTDI